MTDRPTICERCSVSGITVRHWGPRCPQCGCEEHSPTPLRLAYEPMVRQMYPDLVEQHGMCAVWEALAGVGQEQMRRETGLPL